MLSYLLKVLGSLILVLPALIGACYLFSKFCKPDIGNLNPMAWKGLALVQTIFYSGELICYGYGLEWCANNKISLLVLMALVIVLFSVGIFIDQGWVIWPSAVLFPLAIVSIFGYYQSLAKYQLNYVLLSLIMTIFIFMAIMYFFGYLQLSEISSEGGQIAMQILIGFILTSSGIFVKSREQSVVRKNS